MWSFNKQLTDVDWVISPSDFMMLYMTDLIRALNGLPPSASEDKLKNPSTGNVFHRIGFKGDYVIGFRVLWEGFGSNRQLGIRYRIEKLDEAKETTTERIRERIKISTEEYNSVSHQIDIAEPPPLLTQAINEKVYELEIN